MGGAGLIAIKRRVKSVTNTRKITKAMGLVATAKLRKARERLTINEDYYEAYSEIIREVFENIDERSIYLNGNGNKKRMYIVFTSEMGLCGGFNVNAVNKTIEAVGTDKVESLVMVVGQKGKTYFNRLKYETAAEYVEVPDVPSIKEAAEISRHAVGMYEKREVGEVYAVYTKFISAVRQQIEVERLLPMNIEEKSVTSTPTIFEPEVHEIAEEAAKLYFNEKILNCMLHSKSSEHSSRMNAMDGATKNANELLEKLNLKYNRVRQSVITQEISEIVGGAEAQR